MSKVDLHVMPPEGWTPENIEAYRDEWWRQFYENAPNLRDWNLEDPEGRIKKGQRICWSHSEPGPGDMEVIHLCAPSGLYRRPLREGDEDWRVKNAALCGGLTPCSKDDPDAVYQRENLMVFFRYIATNTGTAGHAIHMTVVADKI